jgi:3'-phosphoadenosine 5'-phosphosulfate sulfotransferase (PAPS reductase)/FAD synthetase
VPGSSWCAVTVAHVTQLALLDAAAAIDTAPLERLNDYSLICVSSSAGKDSQAMLDVVCEHARAQGVLDRVVVMHADLGEAEWPGTLDLAAAQAARYGVRFETCRREQPLLEGIRARGRWPSAAQRYCTSSWKRDELNKLIRALTRELPATGRPPKVLSLIGLRAQESRARACKPATVVNARVSNSLRHVDEHLPLLKWTIDDVWARIRSSATADLVHPAYAHGMSRLSCVFCVFAPKRELVVAARHNPALFARYLAAEGEMDHTFRQNLSLVDIAVALQSGEAPDPPEAWAA